MLYWRDEYFQTLKDTAAAASTFPEWLDYALFCSELETGLRRQAFVALRRFIAWIEGVPFGERRRFVSWLLSRSENQKGRHLLIPQPLQTRVIEPTLVEWAAVEPECAEPHRWIGGQEHLEKAIELDPLDHLARRKLILWLLGQVDFASHELPLGYIGSVSEGLTALKRAEELLVDLPDSADRLAYAADIADERSAIERYRQSR